MRPLGPAPHNVVRERTCCAQVGYADPSNVEDDEPVVEEDQVHLDAPGSYTLEAAQQ